MKNPFEDIANHANWAVAQSTRIRAESNALVKCLHDYAKSAIDRAKAHALASPKELAELEAKLACEREAFETLLNGHDDYPPHIEEWLRQAAALKDCKN